jgi:dihydrofolate reductase
MTRLSLIAAMTRNRVIGKDNGMPWHLPADLAHFKATTLNKPVLMGRRTFESIGRPLPGRHNVVLTRDPGFAAVGVDIAHDLDSAMALAQPAEEIMVIGGANLYRQCLPHAQRLYITWIDAELEGDAHFPSWDPDEWREIHRERHPADERNAYDLTFVTYDRM